MAKIVANCDPRICRRTVLHVIIVAVIVSFIVVNRRGYVLHQKQLNSLAITKATIVQKTGQIFSAISSDHIPELVRTTYHESLSNFSQYFIPRWEIITPLNFTFKSATRTECGAADEHPFLVFVILSMVQNRKLRNAVRETWGSAEKTRSWPDNVLKEKIMVIFVIGTSSDDSELDEESKEKGDIIHVSVVEDYFNLTYKVLMGFLWLKKFCSNVKFIAKIDEDTFPDVPVFIEILTSVDMSNTVMGPCFTRGKVERSGKYGVSIAGYPIGQYPPHCKGNFYLMPAELAFKVLDAAQHLPYVNMEDAHISGIIPASVGGVRFRGLNEAQYHLHKSPGMCEYINGTIIVGQKVDPTLGVEIWKRFHDHSLCPKNDII